MKTLIGEKAPAFKATAVVAGSEFIDDFSLEQYKGTKNIVLFFYPLDFTFVCPTELLDFQGKLIEFEKRDAVVIGCSVDSHFCHWAWLNTLPKDGGIKGVTYPLISDLKRDFIVSIVSFFTSQLRMITATFVMLSRRA